MLNHRFFNLIVLGQGFESSEGGEGLGLFGVEVAGTGFSVHSGFVLKQKKSLSLKFTKRKV
jgi:hypothetical protein